MKDIANNRNELYYEIVKDIIDNEEYLELKSIKHHGLDRYEHSKRVSYYSFLISKKLHLDYESAARAGALHDFFLVENVDTKIKDRIKTLEKHPKISLENSNYHFELNDLEENIILSHMFPVVPKYLPKYLESWIVDIVDDWVGVGEKIYSIRMRLTKMIKKYD